MDFEKDFNTWLEENHYYTINRFIDHEQGDTYIASFKELPLSMQWGVIVDFFDENGILIEIQSWWIGTKKVFDWKIRTSDIFTSVQELPTRHEARKAAYEKAKEIYEQLKQ